jgi:dGTPase
MEKLDLQNFEGNAQGLRILTQLEGHLFDGGLRPTLATLGSFVKYPWSSGPASIQKPKFGFFQSEKEHMEEIASELGLTPKGVGSWARHPLAYLVEAADDICYAIIDLEDALEVGILDFNEVESILLNGLSPNERHQYETIYEKDFPRRVSYLRGKIVDYLVQEVMYVLFNEEVSILNGEFVGDLISRCDDAATNIISSAKNLASRKVFHQPRKSQIEIGAYSIIDVLLTAFCDANSEFKNSNPSFRAQRVFDLLGIGAPATDQELYQSLIRITDFVSGSTDKYAAQLSRRLIGMDF